MTETRTARAHVIVRGRVQGVWFRGATRRRARELDLDGWVRNCPDGGVEAVFEGAEEAVRAAVEFVHHGPPSARVVDVEVVEEAPTGTESRFSIRH